MIKILMKRKTLYQELLITLTTYSALVNLGKYYYYWLERILTMVYFVQNYLASFGLYPSSGMWKFYKRAQRFGDWICLRPQVDGAG
jgi:hypothetical protein